MKSKKISQSKRFSNIHVLRSSEMIVNLQWKSSEKEINENFENIKDEIANVVIYAIRNFS